MPLIRALTRYYMLKEIDEQPAVMRRLVSEYLDADGQPMVKEQMLADIADADHIYIIGAGTSYHAGLVGARMFEKFAKTPTTVHVSSEFASTTTTVRQAVLHLLIPEWGNGRQPGSVGQRQ